MPLPEVKLERKTTNGITTVRLSLKRDLSVDEHPHWVEGCREVIKYLKERCQVGVHAKQSKEEFERDRYILKACYDMDDRYFSEPLEPKDTGVFEYLQPRKSNVKKNLIDTHEKEGRQVKGPLDSKKFLTGDVWFLFRDMNWTPDQESSQPGDTLLRRAYLLDENPLKQEARHLNLHIGTIRSGSGGEGYVQEAGDKMCCVGLVLIEAEKEPVAPVPKRRSVGGDPQFSAIPSSESEQSSSAGATSTAATTPTRSFNRLVIYNTEKMQPTVGNDLLGKLGAIFCMHFECVLDPADHELKEILEDFGKEEDLRIRGFPL